MSVRVSFHVVSGQSAFSSEFSTMISSLRCMKTEGLGARVISGREQPIYGSFCEISFCKARYSSIGKNEAGCFLEAREMDIRRVLDHCE